MTVPMRQPMHGGEIIESVLIKGDLGKLTPQERTQYYTEVCRSIGLNPLTKPFEYITLNGKLTLYALRGCADQLRKINGVSLEIVSRDVNDDILTVHVRAKTPDGRVDEDLGSVSFPAGLRGEARANAELKAVTKAKRRATLSICGLGWLDETEIEDIPAVAKRTAPPMPNVMISPPTESAASVSPTHAADAPDTETPSESPVSGAITWEDYVSRWEVILEEAKNAKELHGLWSSPVHKEMRRNIKWPDDDGTTFNEFCERVSSRVKELKAKAA